MTQPDVARKVGCSVRTVARVAAGSKSGPATPAPAPATATPAPATPPATATPAPATPAPATATPLLQRIVDVNLAGRERARAKGEDLIASKYGRGVATLVPTIARDVREAPGDVVDLPMSARRRYGLTRALIQRIVDANPPYCEHCGVPIPISWPEPPPDELEPSAPAEPPASEVRDFVQRLAEDELADHERAVAEGNEREAQLHARSAAMVAPAVLRLARTKPRDVIELPRAKVDAAVEELGTTVRALAANGILCPACSERMREGWASNPNPEQDS